MAIETLLNDASSMMTVISFLTFLGIIAWSYSAKRRADFDDAANLPFADDHADAPASVTEKHNG